MDIRNNTFGLQLHPMTLYPLSSKRLQINGINNRLLFRPKNQTQTAQGLYRAVLTPPRFAADGIQMHVYGTGVILKPVSPYMVDQLLFAADFIRVRSQVFQQTELHTGQLNLFLFQPNDPALAVQCYMVGDRNKHVRRA